MEAVAAERQDATDTEKAGARAGLLSSEGRITTSTRGNSSGSILPSLLWHQVRGGTCTLISIKFRTLDRTKQLPSVKTMNWWTREQSPSRDR